MQDVYKNIDEYNPGKKRKILIVFDDIIADMINNEKLNSIVTELFIKGRKLSISLIFISLSYFKVPKDVRLNSIHFFFNKLHWTIQTLKILLRSTKNVLQNHILF